MSEADAAAPMPDYALAARLTPYVRGALEHWRGPWHIRRAVVLDYLLVYVVSGHGHFSVGDDRFGVGPGSLVWIGPGVLHEMRGVSPTMFVAYLHFDLVHDADRSPRVRSGDRYPDSAHPDIHPAWTRFPIAGWGGLLPVVNGPAVYALMRQTIAEHRGARRPLRISGLMLETIAEIATGLSPSAASAGARWQAMCRAAERIVAKPEAMLDLGSLAAGTRLSISHFRKMFRAVHGESPRDMQIRALMQNACELVLHSDWTITEIAYKLGFSTVHNFSRAFKREIGVSPQGYRQRSS